MADKVRRAAGAEVDWVMAALTLMLPASAPLPVVVTVTLVPASSKLLMAVFKMVDDVPLGVHVPDDALLLLVVLGDATMETL